MKSANIDSIKCEFSEYLFDKTEHPDWLPANPSKAGHKGLSIRFRTELWALGQVWVVVVGSL